MFWNRFQARSTLTVSASRVVVRCPAALFGVEVIVSHASCTTWTRMSICPSVSRVLDQGSSTASPRCWPLTAIRWNIGYSHGYFLACTRKVRVCSAVHTSGRFLGHEGNRTCEAVFTDTGRSGPLTASDNALRRVARIRCLVDGETTLRPRTEARTFASSDSRDSRMRLLVSSVTVNTASTWRPWSLSNRGRPRCGTRYVRMCPVSEARVPAARSGLPSNHSPGHTAGVGGSVRTSTAIATRLRTSSRSGSERRCFNAAWTRSAICTSTVGSFSAKEQGRGPASPGDRGLQPDCRPGADLGSLACRTCAQSNSCSGSASMNWGSRGCGAASALRRAMARGCGHGDLGICEADFLTHVRVGMVKEGLDQRPCSRVLRGAEDVQGVFEEFGFQRPRG